ncbi:hypothetical protein ACFQ71_00580 [Streptomyces sp. NPDC056534]|uniref:hypothetical protein n=1 Tax=Streptomyces sp. NPDC056534 TaxID=3345857 RepID=UPI00367B3ADC
MQPLPEVGDLVRDAATGRVGFYVGNVLGTSSGCPSGTSPGTPSGSSPVSPSGSSPGTPPGTSPGTPSGSGPGGVSGSASWRCLIRPVHGGAEWEAEPADVQPATPMRELRARAAEINARSRRGLS